MVYHDYRYDSTNILDVYTIFGSISWMYDVHNDCTAQTQHSFDPLDLTWHSYNQIAQCYERTRCTI